MYFLRGSLPWQGLKIDKKEDRYKKIYEKKKNTTAEELCQGFPNEFVEYINYTRNLGFEQEPDYEYMKELFRKVMNAYNCENDGNFDWMAKTPQYTQSNSGSNPKVNLAMQNTNNKIIGKIKL
jgi:casein kinase 1